MGAVRHVGSLRALAGIAPTDRRLHRQVGQLPGYRLCQRLPAGMLPGLDCWAGYLHRTVWGGSLRQVGGARQTAAASFCSNLFVGNAYSWIPPRRFDFVRGELVYVPDDYEKAYINHLLANYLEQGGKLLIANYGENHPDPMQGLLPGCHPTRFLLERLDELEIPVLTYRDGYDEVENRMIRVAILGA
jgi:hypothetical protein